MPEKASPVGEGRQSREPQNWKNVRTFSDRLLAYFSGVVNKKSDREEQNYTFFALELIEGLGCWPPEGVKSSRGDAETRRGKPGRFLSADYADFAD
jgi:hypothetical protein